MKDCPVILIPTFSETDNPRPGYRIGADYIQSVADCGGLPVMLPVTADFGPQQAERWLDLADGLLLPGGGDVDPALYGEMPHPKVNAICRGLDDAELLLVKLARQRDLPIFGICRGVQTLAVARRRPRPAHPYRHHPARQPAASAAGGAGGGEQLSSPGRKGTGPGPCRCRLWPRRAHRGHREPGRPCLRRPVASRKSGPFLCGTEKFVCIFCTALPKKVNNL